VSQPVQHVRSLAAVRAYHPGLRVVAAASGKAELLAAIYRALDAPTYAAANYDALADVVGDLGWLPEQTARLGWAPSPSLPEPVRAEVTTILTEAAHHSVHSHRPLVLYLAAAAD
jgi:hypothetical protein